MGAFVQAHFSMCCFKTWTWITQLKRQDWQFHCAGLFRPCYLLRKDRQKDKATGKQNEIHYAVTILLLLLLLFLFFKVMSGCPIDWQQTPTPKSSTTLWVEKVQLQECEGFYGCLQTLYMSRDSWAAVFNISRKKNGLGLAVQLTALQTLRFFLKMYIVCIQDLLPDKSGITKVIL